MISVPFNRPYLTGNEQAYIAEALASGHLSGDGPFTQKCHRWLEQTLGCKKALLTHSCTAALEMAALLAEIGPGDEIIMPSYTFVSTANAFVLRGGKPVFVDIDKYTLNIDENLIEAAITPKTRAIVVVHYAGVSCNMDTIMEIAARHDLLVIEDAAQALLSQYDHRQLGTIGHMAAFSFHQTKNVIAGEGGALVINDNRFVERAEIIREKGTNRSQFLRGDVDKYSWMDIGSSFLPSELNAAFLWAQLEQAEEITSHRLEIWDTYDTALKPLTEKSAFKTQHIPRQCVHNAHMYYLLLENQAARQQFIEVLKSRGIGTVSHYVPLHSSPYGRNFSGAQNKLPVTSDIAGRLVRLPLWVGLKEKQQEVIESVKHTLSAISR